MNRDGLWCLIVSVWMFWAVYGLGTGMETGSMYSQKTENCWHTLMGTCISLPDSGRIGTTCMWQSGEAALQ